MQEDLAGQIKKLKADKSAYRLRVADYRVLFALENDLIDVYDVGSSQRCLSMNTATLKSKSAREIDQQIKHARTVLRELQETLEDLEDFLALEKAKERNAGKPGTPWEEVARELGIRPPPKKRRRKG